MRVCQLYHCFLRNSYNSCFLWKMQVLCGYIKLNNRICGSTCMYAVIVATLLLGCNADYSLLQAATAPITPRPWPGRGLLKSTLTPGTVLYCTVWLFKASDGSYWSAISAGFWQNRPNIDIDISAYPRYWSIYRYWYSDPSYISQGYRNRRFTICPG